MWSALKLAEDHQRWEKLAESIDLESLKSLSNQSDSGERVYYFWDAPFPSDPNKLQELYNEMVDANGGIDIKVIVGATIDHLDNELSASTCGGKCFCVIQGSSRRCEVCYQGGGGPICVACGTAC